MKTVLASLMGIRFLRFCLVGGFSGLTYLAVVVAIQWAWPISAPEASVVGYLCAIPANFAGQKFVTFGSRDKIAREIGPFLLVQGTNIALSLGVMSLVTDALGLDYLIGAFLVIATIPVSTFILLRVFVFNGHGSDADISA